MNKYPCEASSGGFTWAPEADSRSTGESLSEPLSTGCLPPPSSGVSGSLLRGQPVCGAPMPPSAGDVAPAAAGPDQPSLGAAETLTSRRSHTDSLCFGALTRVMSTDCV